MNLRPSGYEPDELPGCSTPRQSGHVDPWRIGKGERGECGPGGDLLFRTLRCSTIGAEGFHGRVRDGIGCLAPRHGHQAGNPVPAEAGISCHVRRGRSVWRPLRALPLCAAAWDEAPIERLVPVSSTGCPAFTSGLSTWWSSTALGETWF